MKLTKLAAIALAALTLTAGAAVAVPGNAPDGIGNDNADTHANEHAEEAGGAENASAADERDENASAADERDDRAADESGDAGPPADLPEQVPEHVSAIHELIQQHVDGVLEGDLGAAVSDVASGNADESAADGDVNATEDEGVDMNATEDVDENATATATAEG